MTIAIDFKYKERRNDMIHGAMGYFIQDPSRKLLKKNVIHKKNARGYFIQYPCWLFDEMLWMQILIFDHDW